MNITICIGSSCYLKGSKDIIAILERLIALHNLQDKVTLVGSFCMGHCTDGVCVRVGEKPISGVNAENFDEKFETEILGELRDE